jgi:hypothetical protein
MNKKIIIKNVLQILFALLIFALFLKRFISFPEKNFVFKEENIPYVGELYNSRFFYFTFFTYNSILLYGAWLLLYSISNLFGNPKGLSFIHNKYVVLSVVVYQVLTCCFYTIFEIFFYPTNFGLGRGLAFSNFFNMFDNLFNHYIVTIFAVWFYIKKAKSEIIDYKKFYHICYYPAIYYIIVLTICHTVVDSKWFPYPIFSSKAMWKTIFGTLSNYNQAIGIIFVVLSLILLFGVLTFIFFVLSKINNKQARQNQ